MNHRGLTTIILLCFVGASACRTGSSVSDAKSLDNIAVLKPDFAVCNDGSKYEIKKLGPDQYEVKDPSGQQTIVSQAQLLAAVCPGPGDSGASAPLTCKDYALASGAQPSVLSIVLHPGFGDHQTLKWPGGATFYLRKPGFGEDRTVFYPNGKPLRLEHPGFGDDRTIRWPNGAVLQLRHPGFGDHLSIFRPDGSTWLLRHPGFGDDGTVTAPLFHEYKVNGETMKAQIDPSTNSFKARYERREADWAVIIRLDQDGITSVEECQPSFDL